MAAVSTLDKTDVTQSTRYFEQMQSYNDTGELSGSVYFEMNFSAKTGETNSTCTFVQDEGAVSDSCVQSEVLRSDAVLPEQTFHTIGGDITFPQVTVPQVPLHCATV